MNWNSIIFKSKLYDFFIPGENASILVRYFLCDKDERGLGMLSSKMLKNDE